MNGERAIGVYSKGDVEIEETSIKAYSSNNENGLLKIIISWYNQLYQKARKFI